MRDRPLVVVVDDDPSVCKALRRLLRTTNMDVETYSAAKDFLAARPLEVDCMVLDIRMPGMTGPDLRDQLLKEGRSIPIVFITAHEEDVPRRGAADSRAEVLQKPFGDQALLDAIGRAMRPAGPQT